MPAKMLTTMRLALLFLFSITTAFAQNANLSGLITDASGASVPHASVTITAQDTGTKRQTTSNDRGLYIAPSLEPGLYTVTVQAPGFQTASQTDLKLDVAQNARLDFKLEVGSIEQKVIVQGGAPLMNTTDGSVSTVVDRQFVENMPLNGRSFQTLIELTPGVVPTTGDNYNGAFSVNGQRQDANAFMVDGVSANFGGGATGASTFNIGGAWASGSLPGLTNLGTTQTLASVDAIQEFRVQTSTYSAEYGRQPGGQISIVTRSGTNQFHGSLFEYLRNTIFDANNWFSNANRRPRPPEHQNDFGGTFGGPVRIPGLYNGKDRTFFFLSYEGLRLRLPQFTLTNVPTLTLRQAVPPSLQPFMNTFPLPNGKDLGNGLAEFSTSYSNQSTLDSTSMRIDHTINDKWRVFGRFNLSPSSGETRRTGNLATLLRGRAPTWTVTTGVISVFSPNLTNDLRANYSDNYAYSGIVGTDFAGAKPQGADALVPAQYITASTQASVGLNFPGATGPFPQTGVLAGKFVDSQALFNIVDTASYQVRSHQFKFGVDFRRLTPTQQANEYSLSVAFISQQQLLNGIAPTAFVSAAGIGEPIYTNYSAFVQDSWKITRRLVADLGLRWDVNPAPGTRNGRLPLGVNQVRDFVTMALKPDGTPQWNTTYLNVAPRLGLAYQLRQRSGAETVLRGGFGMFYDTGNNLAFSGLQGYPNSLSRSITNLVFPVTVAQAAPPALPDLNSLTPPYGTMTLFDPHLQLPYTLHWNVAIEQALGNNEALTVSYVGNTGQQLLINQQYGISAINPKFTTVNITTNRADSSYNALQAQFQRRLPRGWQGLVSYTWSHAIDSASTDSASVFPPVRGNSDFDVRHLLAAAFVFESPKFTNRFTQTVLGNWSLDGGLHAQSALPINVIASQVLNPATGNFNIIFPNVVPSVPFYLSGDACSASNGGVPCPGGRRINPAAFQAPPTGQNGNLGRNILRSLPSWQIDSAIERRFNLTERLSLAFRAEAFNLLNHPNFGLPNATLTAANFGEPTNTQNVAMSALSSLYQIGGPRSGQFSLKLRF